MADRDIPEEAVERAAEALEGPALGFGGPPRIREARHKRACEIAWAALSASGALYLSEEEKEALLNADLPVATKEQFEAWPPARQKLEESLK